MRVNQLLNINRKQDHYLYLLNLRLTDEIIDLFRGIRYVLMQGSNGRALNFAHKLAAQFAGIDSRFFEAKNITNTSRYQIFRIGNILSVSHGMGNPSIMSLLHEITKALYFARSHNVEYIRIGTSGGIGVDPGTVIITNQAYSANLKPYYELISLDNTIQIPTNFDQALTQKIYNAQPRNLSFNVDIASTIAADDFYLGQGRFDGASIITKDLAQRNDYFTRAQALGIRNFEMESTALAAFCQQTEIPAAMIGVTLINRLNGDQVSSTPEELATYADRAQIVAINYLAANFKLDDILGK